MTKISLAISVMSLGIAASCAPAADYSNQSTPYQLSRAELSQVQMGVGAYTGLPNLLIVDRVAAASDNDGVVTACGIASLQRGGDKGSAFAGILTSGHFTVVGMADDWSSQQAVYTVCEKNGVRIGEATGDASAARNAEVKSLLAQARELNRRCRGTEGATNPAVCEQRDAKFDELNNVGWCYGKEGEFGYQQEWHMCGPTSIR